MCVCAPLSPFINLSVVVWGGGRQMLLEVYFTSSDIHFRLRLNFIHPGSRLMKKEGTLMKIDLSVDIITIQYSSIAVLFAGLQSFVWFKAVMEERPKELLFKKLVIVCVTSLLAI